MWGILWYTRMGVYDPNVPNPEIDAMKENARTAAWIAVTCMDCIVSAFTYIPSDHLHQVRTVCSHIAGVSCHPFATSQ